MPRKKLIPDETVFATIRAMLHESGDKAVSFAKVAKATGLAAPTLVQRFGTRDGMVKAARMAAWDLMDAATQSAIEKAADKGPQGLLKALDASAANLPDPRDADLSLRAARWRATIESALALRFGGGEKGREAAAMLFAVWQGQRLWQGSGNRGFRLKEAVRRLT